MGKSVFVNKELMDRTANFRVQQQTEVVIKRALALAYVCLLSEALGTQSEEDEKFIMELIEKSGLKEHMTPSELKFVEGTRVQQDVVQFNWHYERLAVLLCMLGQKVDLKRWDKLAEAAQLIGIIHNKNFVKKAKLQKLKKIAAYEQEANEAYWICVDAKINKKPISDYSKKEINSEVAMERLSAIRWLYSSQKTGWDDCSADTYLPYKPVL